MANKKFSINIDPEQVVYTNISKSKDGYNSARLVVKANEKEYMSISYEWEGSHVPDFAMNLMSFMKANQLEVGKNYEEEAQKEKMCPDCKKPMSKCACEKEEDMEE